MNTRHAIRARDCEAFTLLEMVTISAIILILAALVLAGVQSVRRQGNTTQSFHNIRVLAAASMGYVADYGRYAPADDKWNLRRWHGARKSLSEPFNPEEGFLSPYFGKSHKVTPCPVFQGMLKGEESFEEGTGGYGYNSSYVGGKPGGSWLANGNRESALASEIEHPTQTVMFTSTAYARANGIQEYAYCEPPFWDFGNGASEQRPSPSVHFRFNGRALVAWCDGHVSFESPVKREAGVNPHGGEVDGKDLGWFGPEDDNGWWNPRYEPKR